MLRDIVPPSQFKQLSDGILLFYDINRTKFLSTDRSIFTFGIDSRNLAIDTWMRAIDSIPSNNSGYKLVRNGTIVSATVQTQNIADCTVYIRRNNDFTNLTSLILNGVDSQTNNTLNIDLNANDWMQSYITITSGNVDYPILTLEIAWRE